ncbi:MAG: dipeptide ABC transporter ATP-binding protein [Dehalococcoidia bacterium]|nr:dipeptide ABC transporter ATP-binding protein [Dehalococcoidia bacterium]MDW8120238.1 dipeptide ABC transporter ATP-binding protein [Chloroflexota bacterium]
MNGSPSDGQVLLEAREVKKYFPVGRGLFRKPALLKAVDGVSFVIRQGETLGLVGESGCGKTTTAKMVLMLETPTAGTILFEGQDVVRMDGAQRKRYRQSVQAVFQDPWASLNPRMRVGKIVAEPLDINLKLSPQETRERVAQLLENVGLNPHHATLYPHEFSGGQRQRIAIARALALNPKLIVLDEPVSALDVSIRAQIMNLLKDLQKQFNLSYLLIAHHLATVRYMCHRVAVMYLGRIVESAPSGELFDNPLHPYTKALLSAALPSHPDIHREEIILTGEVPSPLNIPRGCRFHPRCPFAMPHCSQVEPPTLEVRPGHQVACHLYGSAS